MQRIIDFILEADKLKTVTRKTRPLGLDRNENSAEHSWQLGLLAISLARFADPAIDMHRVTRMLLVHDMGEIDIGDTMVYVEEGREERKAAELKAVVRVFGMLPDDLAEPFLSLWQEFDNGKTSEARFAHAVDRAMPVLLNLANDGQSWRENGISYDRVIHSNRAPIQAGCPQLWGYLEPRLKQARQKGLFGA
jgi:putative hydrolase of HD superfamily